MRRFSFPITIALMGTYLLFAMTAAAGTILCIEKGHWAIEASLAKSCALPESEPNAGGPCCSACKDAPLAAANAHNQIIAKRNTPDKFLPLLQVAAHAGRPSFESPPLAACARGTAFADEQALSILRTSVLLL